MRSDFHSGSDVDVMIEPRHIDSWSSYCDMIDELESMFGRDVDLVTRHAVDLSENTIRRDEILGTAKEIYAEEV